MKSLVTINIAKKQLGLDEDKYREVLKRITGKTSLRDMCELECLKIIDEFKSKGFKQVSKNSGKQLDGKFAPKLQALWIA